MIKNIGKGARLLIASDLIYRLTAIFIDTFLVAYLLKITNENITTISLYYITIYGLRVIIPHFVGMIIKKQPSTNKEFLSLGIIVRAVFILFIAVLSDKITSYFITIAIIYAISETFYWYPHEAIYISVTTNKNRNNYMAFRKILYQVIGIISPIIFGTSIELYSFSKIAIWVFLLSVVQIVLTFCIKTNVDKKEPKKYSYKKFLKYVKDNQLTKIKSYHHSGVAYGILESSINTLIVVITVMTFKTSFNLGVLTSVFAVCAILSLIIYSKFGNKKNFNKTLILCSIVIITGVVATLIDINKISLIIYNFCYILTFSIFDVIYNAKKGNLVKECKIQEYQEEYIIYASISVCLGRAIGYTLMLIASFTGNVNFLKLLLALFTLFAPIFCYYISKTEDKKKIAISKQ